MGEKEKGQGEGAGLEEVKELLTGIFEKVSARGTATAREKFRRALAEFRGTLKQIDDELER
jgi:hypothetical protein